MSRTGELSGTADIVIVGAGAAGLMAATFAAAAAGRPRVVVLDGAAKLGAKILVAGGGRCNVTHDVVDETAFAGSTRPAVRKVLRRFGVAETVSFFRDLGVTLVREDTGKLFPSTNRARTVLDALLRAAQEAGAELLHPRRVTAVQREGEGEGYAILGPWGVLRAPRVILTTGGRSLPKSGSDGHGFVIARALGHALTPRILPALVPLVLRDGSFLRELTGLATPARLEVRSGTDRRLAAFEGALLCTHFGVSGPVVLDASRYFLAARAEDEGARLVVSFAPGETTDSLDARLLRPARASAGVARELSSLVPERLARALCAVAGADPAARGDALKREDRRRLAGLATNLTLDVQGPRSWEHAEVTAGGVPLAQLRLDTLESRVQPGLHFAGEILDVDGLVGGYNFQWAFASGHVAGLGAAG